MGNYRKMESGDTIEVPDGGVVYSQCCDCGLVHREEYSIEPDSGTVTVTIYRDNRRTGQARRWRNIKVRHVRREEK